MNFYTQIQDFLFDERLLFNLIAIHLLWGLTLFVSMVLRRLLIHGSNHVVKLTGMHWLHGVSQEAAKRARAFLFWTTLGAMVTVALGGVVYHLAGRDVRIDVHDWYRHLTWIEVVHVVMALGELGLLGTGIWLGVRQLRQWLPRLHAWAACHLGHKGKEEALKRWFSLLERYAILMLVLGAAWLAGQIVGLGHFANIVVGFIFRMLTILGAAHLLTLSCQTLSHALTNLGNRHLGQGQFRRYWERVTRLFPFGERCFEAAVYVSAATMIIRELEFIAFVAKFGPRIVQCIGIFFGTRVLIELTGVLLYEAFGVGEEETLQDQKRQTLVPLLQSISQYVLYFGSVVMMLGVLGVETGPILAGAGILGLGVGLGAQSLVTDVVSGFFILFENQYLVGDYVKVNDSAGRVEAVSIRHTQIRDDQGRLHIIPNGQIKGVINYSKNYVIAEVDIKVPTDRNVDEIFRAMTEAGRRLRQGHKEVLADTVIKGIVDLTPSDMTIRAVTKVHPGSHQAMQNEYRRLLKEVFDEQKALTSKPAMAA